MQSFGHKMFISSQPVPLTGTGVFYPRVQDFLFENWLYRLTNFYRDGMETVIGLINSLFHFEIVLISVV